MSLSLQASEYQLDSSHSRMGFKISHLVVSSVYGSFETFSGSFQFNENKKSLSNFSITISPASINTSDAKRDKHLRGEDFFDVKKYPEIKFESSEVIRAKKGGAKLKGKLTLHGVTKEVTLKVKYKGIRKDPWGNRHLALEVNGRIHRKDFGLDWNKKLDEGGVLIGDEVEILVEVQGIEQ